MTFFKLQVSKVGFLLDVGTATASTVTQENLVAVVQLTPQL
jgi:hypothetical protein